MSQDMEQRGMCRKLLPNGNPVFTRLNGEPHMLAGGCDDYHPFTNIKVGKAWSLLREPVALSLGVVVSQEYQMGTRKYLKH